MPSLRWLMLPLAILPGEKAAACWSDGDVALFSQMSAVRKKSAIWQIEGQRPWQAYNGYNDIAIKYSNRCSLVEDQLRLNMDLYGFAYYPLRHTGTFEQDDQRVKLLFDRLSLTYNISETIKLETGKISRHRGLFYLVSPADLLNNYAGGFKPTRIYHPAMKQATTESSWGAELSETGEQHALSFSVAPKLTQPGARYASSTAWSSLERSNSTERYLLSYTDYRYGNNVPSASLMLGDTPAVALGNSYNVSQQLTFNSELAWHRKSPWRHLDEEKVSQLQNYTFPDALYHTPEKQNVELALGLQYTSDRFSQFGVAYYFQSAGYSARQWRKQTDLINFLNQRTQNPALESAFDNYKYLMASEIYNTTGKGHFLGKHYINSYASIVLDEHGTLHPWSVLNITDKSSILGVTFTRRLNSLNKQMEIYTGIYAAVGNKHSEFGLFGETFGTYMGFYYTF